MSGTDSLLSSDAPLRIGHAHCPCPIPLSEGACEAIMPTAVQLTLSLDSSGALSVLDRLKQAWAGFKSSVITNNAELSQSFNATSTSLSGIESAEQRAHIAGQLFTRTLGVEMPRALETVIARSQVLGPLLQGLFGVSIFAAAIPAIAGIAEKLIDVSKQAEIHRQAWIEINATVQDTGEKIVDQLNKEKEKYIELTQGPIAAMQSQISNMRSVAIAAFQD